MSHRHIWLEIPTDHNSEGTGQYLYGKRSSTDHLSVYLHPVRHSGYYRCPAESLVRHFFDIVDRTFKKLLEKKQELELGYLSGHH